MFGPYHLPVGPLRAAGVVAVVVALAAVSHTVRAWRDRREQGGLALGTTMCLIALGATAAIGWRICTAGGVGANIGAGFVLLVGPVCAAGLVVGAVLFECAARQVRPWLTTLLAGLALLTAPALWSGAIALSAYDQGRGVITAEDFARVQVGDPRDGVRSRLGSRGEVVDWFFPAPPEGSTCDYWSGALVNGSSLQYRVCSAGGRVVVTEVSSDPYTPQQSLS